MKTAGPYQERDARAARLLEERPHAAEILSLYRHVLAAQRPRYARVVSRRWLKRDSDLRALPFAKLVRPLRRATEEIAEGAPEALAAAGGAVAAARDEALQALLERTASLEPLDGVAEEVGCEVLPLLFYARSFLQPVAEGLADREISTRDAPSGGTPAAADGVRENGGHREPRSDVGPDGIAAREGAAVACPRCGWPPQVALLRDDPDAKGRELLVCGLCGTEWPFPRLRCPNCGETASDKLLFHQNEGQPYLQVAECSTCHAYLKTVDLREQGHAVPVVEDLASPELDVWADEHGLWKISRNLMGL